jgi:hypothetical protein
MTQSDPFGEPQSEFITAKDFVGRLVLVTPTGVETGIESTMPDSKGKTYDRVIADVVVLDGAVTDKFDVIPCRLEGQLLSGAGLVPQLTKRTSAGPVPGRMTLGRFGHRRGKWPQPAVVMSEATDADKQVARNYLASLDPFAA